MHKITRASTNSSSTAIQPLGIGAIGKAISQVVPMLVADTLVVGYLATLMMAASLVVAERAAGRAGTALASAETARALDVRLVCGQIRAADANEICSFSDIYADAPGPGESAGLGVGHDRCYKRGITDQ